MRKFGRLDGCAYWNLFRSKLVCVRMGGVHSYLSEKKLLVDSKIYYKINLSSFLFLSPYPLPFGLVHGSMNICGSVHGSRRLYAGTTQIKVESEFHLVAD